MAQSPYRLARLAPLSLGLRAQIRFAGRAPRDAYFGNALVNDDRSRCSRRQRAGRKAHRTTMLRLGSGSIADPAAI